MAAGLAFVAACSGTEELALNPAPSASSGEAGGSASGPGAGSSSGASMAASGAASNATDPGSAGDTAQAGQGLSSCRTDIQCAAPTPRCAATGSCVACLSDDDCQRDEARRCSEQGRCVACVDNEDCSDNEDCETLTATCQACATSDCAGTAGASADEEKP